MEGRSAHFKPIDQDHDDDDDDDDEKDMYDEDEDYAQSEEENEALLYNNEDSDENEWRREIILLDKQLNLNSQQVSSQASTSKVPEDVEHDKDTMSTLDIMNECGKGIAASRRKCSALNHEIQKILRKMEAQLLLILEKNKREQDELIKYINKARREKTDAELCQVHRFNVIGIPYFKDQNGFYPPNNKDVEKKICNKEILPVDFILNNPTWRNNDTQKLKIAVFANAEEKLHESLVQKKSGILRSQSEDSATLLKKVNEDLENINHLVSTIKINPRDIDWMKISTIDLNDKFSESECEAKWSLSLCPKINHGKWTSQEWASLMVLVKIYKLQDWDGISLELGTNRTGLQCCAKYRSTFPTLIGKWSEEEDQQLLDLVEQFRIKDNIPWQKVVWYFQTRSLRQCQERYYFSLCGLQNGRFTKNEDMLIVRLAEDYDLDFRKIQKYLPTRSVPQIRTRYQGLVLNSKLFTNEENDILKELVSIHNNDWTKISSYFKGNHSKGQCKRHWETLKMKKKNEGGSKNKVFPKIKLKAISTPRQESFDSAVSRIVAKKRKSKTKRNKSVIDVRADIAEAAAEIRRTKDPDQTLTTALVASCALPFTPHTKMNEDHRVFTHSKYSPSLQRLLQHESYFHEFIFGPRNRTIPIRKMDFFLEKMSVALYTLSADIDLSQKVNMIESLTEEGALQLEDNKVLTGLALSPRPVMNLGKILAPPNFTTLLGLRTLSLARSHIHKLSSEYERLGLKSERNPNVRFEDRLLFQDAKNLWCSRLKCLFQLSMACSFITQEEKPPIPSKRKPPPKCSIRRMKHHARMMNKVCRLKKKNPDLSRDEIYALLDEPPTTSTTSPSASSKPVGVGRGRPRKVQGAEMVLPSGTRLSGDDSSLPPKKRARMIKVVTVPPTTRRKK